MGKHKPFLGMFCFDYVRSIFSIVSFLFISKSGIDEEDEEIARLRISPPPTPINRYLQSVHIYKRNQIKIGIPRFILRGIGRDSYHVFEVKVNSFRMIFLFLMKY